MSPDEALMWLNDRRGQNVVAEIRSERRGDAVTVMAASGELRHWREVTSLTTQNLGGPARDDLAGLYVVGRAQIDLSDIGEGGAVEVGCDQLRVELAADLWLTVTTGAQNGEQGREPA